MNPLYQSGPERAEQSRPAATVEELSRIVWEVRLAELNRLKCANACLRAQKVLLEHEAKQTQEHEAKPALSECGREHRRTLNA